MSDNPICPHCQHIDHDWWDGLDTKYDGDSWITTCPSCGKDYEVTMNISYDFETTEG